VDITLGTRLENVAVGQSRTDLFPHFLLKVVKHILHRATFAEFRACQSFLDGLDGFQPLREIERSLMGFRILHDQLGLAVDGEHQRMTSLLELDREFGRVALKVRQWVNIASTFI
jgi:hypothetical protein